MADEDFVETDGEPLGDDESYSGSLTATLRDVTSGSTPSETSRNPRAEKQTAPEDFDPRSTLYRGGDDLEGGEEDDDPLGERALDPLVQARQDQQKQPQQQQQPPQDAALDVFAEANALGVDLRGKFRTQRDAIKGLVNAHRLVGQRNEAAQMWDSLRTDPEFQQQVYARLHSQYGIPQPPSPQQQHSPPQPTPEQTAPPPASKPASRIAPPKWNPAWTHHFNSDGTPKPNADPNVVAAAEEFRADRRLFQEDPDAYFAKYVNPTIEQRAAEIVDKRLKEIEEERQAKESQRQQEEAQRRQFDQVRHTTIDRMQNEGWFDWIYEPGFQVVNGEVVGELSDRGRLFNQYLAEAAQAQEYGLPLYPHPMQRANYARQRVIDYLSVNGAPQPGQQAQAHAHEDTRMDRTPGGSVGTAVRQGEYPKGMSLSQKLAHDLRAMGIQNV